MKRPLRHIVDYFILSIVVSAAVLLMLLTNGNRMNQKIIVITLSVLYFIWGVFHHKREGTLHGRILMEYLTFAILGSILVLGLL